MMHPPIAATLIASAGVRAVLGNPVRVYPFGEATQNTPLPYLVFQTVAGTPENYLNQTPDMDGWVQQVDIYAATLNSAYACAQAVRDALEPVAHITSWRGESKDPDTNHYRYSMDVDFLTSR